MKIKALHKLVDDWIDGRLEAVVAELEKASKATLVEFISILINERHIQVAKPGTRYKPDECPPLTWEGWQDMARLEEMLKE